MIGKQFRLLPTVAMLASMTTGATYASADCSQMETESAAGVGVHVRLSDTGAVEAIFAMGEGNFLAPKRSLIKKARTVATLDAKRQFSAWLEEAVAGGTVASSLLEQVETTDQDGMTSGTAEEITQAGEAMSSATANVLNGLVKLDECLDTAEKYILVELGWKPALSDAARQATDNIQGSNSQNTDSGAAKTSNSTSKIVPSEGYRKKSKVKDDF
jgi:hypothetical protein